MSIDLQFKIKSNPIYIKFLHENSNWYKILNRDENMFNEFVNSVKIAYGLRPVDKINKALSTFEMISSIVSTLNSN